MKSYKTGNSYVVEVSDLSFLYDREHFTWIGREFRHFRLKKALKKADVVIAQTAQAATDVHKYYRVPAEIIRTVTK